MRLVGKDKIQGLLREDDSISKWLQAWVAELVRANWKHPDDVREQFPNTRLTELGHFVFPIVDCDREVHLQIAFPQGIALITGLK